MVANVGWSLVKHWGIKVRLNEREPMSLGYSCPLVLKKERVCCQVVNSIWTLRGAEIKANLKH